MNLMEIFPGRFESNDFLLKLLEVTSNRNSKVLAYVFLRHYWRSFYFRNVVVFSTQLDREGAKFSIRSSFSFFCKGLITLLLHPA